MRKGSCPDISSRSAVSYRMVARFRLSKAKHPRNDCIEAGKHKNSKQKPSLSAGSDDLRILAFLRTLSNVDCLRTLLTFHDFELYRIPLLQALVALGLNRAVMHENIWPILPPDESEALGIVKPLYGTFQSRHLLSLRTG